MDLIDHVLLGILPEEVLREIVTSFLHPDVDAPLKRRKMDVKDPYSLQLNDAEWRSTFRFAKRHIGRLCDAFHLCATVSDGDGHTAPSDHVMLWLLYRCVGGATFQNCQLMFGPHRSTIARLVSRLEGYIADKAKATLQGFHVMLDRAQVDRYKAALTAKGSCVSNVWGFIDGVKWVISRPGGHPILQRAVYSGYKKAHCLSFHVVSSPDGMIQHLYGPLPGHTNDINVLEASALQDKMAANAGMF
jgi:hypothetical protein